MAEGYTFGQITKRPVSQLTYRDIVQKYGEEGLRSTYRARVLTRNSKGVLEKNLTPDGRRLFLVDELLFLADVKNFLNGKKY